MSINFAVLPVAGRGTRLLPLTKSQPKEMLPVGRQPVVQYVVEELAAAGVNKLVFITGPGKTAIENHFDIDEALTTHLRTSGKEELLGELAYEREQIEYFYTRQRRQLGLGHAVLCARSIVHDSPFVVALGDSLIGLRGPSRIVPRMIEACEQRGADAVIAFEKVPAEHVVRFGIAKPRGKATEIFELADVVEKPSRAEAPSELAISGRYVLSPAIFDILAETAPGKGNEIQLTDALRTLIARGGKVLGVQLAPGEHRYDVGSFDSYYRAFIQCALADGVCGADLREYLRELLNREDET